MLKLKILTHKAAYLKARHIAAICADLTEAESFAPVNVHSHGNMIENLEREAEALLLLVREFKTEIQGR